MVKPSIHEIAAMPYPESVKAMRKHYNPIWCKYDNDAETNAYRVTIEYSTRSTGKETFEIEAATEKEAEEIAEDQFFGWAARRLDSDDYEIEEITVKDLTA